MRYASFNHAGWIEQQIGKPLSPFAARVAHIVGIAGGGIYNAPIDRVDRINWGDDRIISMQWRTELATQDYNALTCLVILSHVACIRLAIRPCTPQSVRLAFWQRKPDGHYADRHPSIEENVALITGALPANHPVRFGVIEARAVSPGSQEPCARRRDPVLRRARCPTP